MARSAQTPDDAWINRLLGGDRGALARSITWVENQTTDGAKILAAIQQSVGRAVVVGFTGPPLARHRPRRPADPPAQKKVELVVDRRWVMIYLGVIRSTE